MRRAVQELRPTSVKDLAALVALYRPGPMQHIATYIRAKDGLEEIAYPHADLAELLDETYGVIVYQDQVLHIAQKFAGYTLGQADIMRKAMGKKIKEMMSGEEQRFLEGAVARGYSRELAQQIYDLIEPFAGYRFNKRGLESMVKAGAFDSLCASARGGLLASLDRAIALAQRTQRQREAGQGSLFDLMGEEAKPSLGELRIDESDTPQSERLAWGGGLLGGGVSGHLVEAAWRGV